MEPRNEPVQLSTNLQQLVRRDVHDATWVPEEYARIQWHLGIRVDDLPYHLADIQYMVFIRFKEVVCEQHGKEPDELPQ